MFSAGLFAVGVYGVLARRNGVLVLMSIELMLNAVNVNLVAFSQFLKDTAFTGQIFTLFVITVAAVELGISVDGLAAMMMLVVTLVSLMVHVYSVGYMRQEPRYTWYFAALSLFTGSMLNLVIANNLIQLLVGWELVGICSYLLI